MNKMTTYCIWKKVNGKKVTILKLKSSLEKEEIRSYLKINNVAFNGIDSIYPAI